MSNPPLVYVLTPLSFILGMMLSSYAKRLLARRQLGITRKASRLTSALDSSINARLSHVRAVMDADKAKIYQFQTTTIYFNHRPLKKMSLTHIQLKEGIAIPNLAALQSLPTSVFPNMMGMLLNNQGIIYWDANKAPDDFLRAKHRDEAIDAVMVAGIYCKDTGNLLGFIGLNWVGRKPTAKDPTKFLALASDLGAILGH